MYHLIKEKRVISIIGMGKNVGKTTALNAILSHIPNTSCVAVTSIGFDGEALDNITHLPKPKIWVKPKTLFATTQYGLDHSTIDYDIIEETNIDTALGKVLIGVVVSEGAILLCGPATNTQTKEVVTRFFANQANHVMIDGAFGKKALANASIADGAILATGASFSNQVEDLIEETLFVSNLYQWENVIKPSDESNPPIEVCSILGKEKDICGNIQSHTQINVQGALTNTMINVLLHREDKPQHITFVLDHPSMCFVDRLYFQLAKKRNIAIKFRHTTEIIAITINPTASIGLGVDGNILQKELTKRTSIPVIDVMKAYTR